MSMAYLTDNDLRKIVKAAIRLVDTGRKPTSKTIAAIADGDDDIPEIITNLAGLCGLTWSTEEGGYKFLDIERQLDLEDLETAGSEPTP